MDMSESTGLTEPQIESLINLYHRELARYETMASSVADRVRRELRATARRHLLSFRAKHPEDLREKLRRKRAEPRYSYQALREDMNAVVTDLAGCRVLLYDPAEEDGVAETIKGAFAIAAREGAIEKHAKPSGYRATHILVTMPDSHETLSVRGALCEIQICSLGAHVFNELEHNIVYKDHGCPPTKEEEEYIRQLRLASELLDGMARNVQAERVRSVDRRTMPLATPEDLKYAIEQAASRPLRGDFVRLHRLLDVVAQPLTMSVLTRDHSIGKLIELGQAESGRHQILKVDDVVHLALGLLKEYALEFREVALQWRGPTTSLKEAILKATSNQDGEEVT